MRIGVIAPTFADARDVCIEGESGLLRIVPKDCLRAWHRSTGDLVLFNDSRIKLYSADQPERLRGPQHHRIWCDEIGAWPRPDAFDQMWFGLRLGRDPRVVVTTTPRNTPLVHGLVAREGQDVFVTRGRTWDNAAHLAPHVLSQLENRYAGTLLGRQELEAELINLCDGSLWIEGDLDKLRVDVCPAMARVVVGVDPALTSKKTSDETGIVVAGLGCDGLIYILHDASGTYAPDIWATLAVSSCRRFGGQMIVCEVNAGGDLVGRVIAQMDPSIPIKTVRAVVGKMDRALPVAAMYQQGRVRHVGRFEKLELQMCSFAPDIVAARSPDRVDAMVWAVTALMEQSTSAPRMRAL